MVFFVPQDDRFYLSAGALSDVHSYNELLLHGEIAFILGASG